MLDIGKRQWHRGDVVSYDEQTGIHTIHAPSWNVNQDHMYRVHMSINFVSISIVPPVNGVVPIRPLWRPLVMPPLQQGAPQEQQGEHEMQAEQGAPQVQQGAPQEQQGEHEMQAEQGAPQVQQGAPQVQQGEHEMQAEQAPPQEQQGAPQVDELVELLRRMPKLPDIDMFIESGRKRNHVAVPAMQILQPGMTDRNKTFVIAEGLTTIMAAMKLSLVRQGC